MQNINDDFTNCNSTRNRNDDIKENEDSHAGNDENDGETSIH